MTRLMLLLMVKEAIGHDEPCSVSFRISTDLELHKFACDALARVQDVTD
jgi:hypothetical protein